MRLTSKDKQRLAQQRVRQKAHADKLLSLPLGERLAYIPAQSEPSEFEIQSFIYESLKRAGVTVRGEVKTICGTCVFDIVVYQEGKPVRIIEVKKTRKGAGSPSMKRGERKSRRLQVKRYEAFGLPVDLVCTMSNARKYVDEFIKSL